MQTRKTLNTDTFHIVIPKKMKSTFTLQGNKRLYPSESNACELYGNAKLHNLPAFGTVDCFFYVGFLSPAFTIHWTVGEGEATSLNLLYHFRLLHRHLDLSLAIAAESLPLSIVSKQT